MEPVRIGLIGATGETGSSILHALLSEGPNIYIVALSRPSSLDKPANRDLQAKGIELRALDTTAPPKDVASSLHNIDVLICAIGGADQHVQIPIASAARIAGVKRFIPCAYLPVIPLGGVSILRDMKQQVYNQIFQLRLPYTIVDVGWWSQLSIPRVPSGKLDAYAYGYGDDEIPGDGTVSSALTDLRDIGRYIVKIALDDRTLNKWVFVYNELWSQNAIYDLVEEKSGEKIERNYVSETELMERIAQAGEGSDMEALMIKVPAQYRHSWGIRGDNTPEYAKYLGYLTSKELYPDLQFHSFESLIDEAIAGTAQTVYDDLKAATATSAASR